MTSHHKELLPAPEGGAGPDISSLPPSRLPTTTQANGPGVCPVQKLSLSIDRRLFPPRISSLTVANNSVDRSPFPPQASSLPVAGSGLRLIQQPSIKQNPVQRKRDTPPAQATIEMPSGFLSKAKQKLKALFSPSKAPAPPTQSKPPTTQPISDALSANDNPPNSANSPSRRDLVERHARRIQREQAALVPIPGRPNSFWLPGRSSAQRRKEKAERRRLRQEARERQFVTAESVWLVGELEWEGIEVRDFQYEHEQMEEEEEAAAEEKENEAKAGLTRASSESVERK